MSERPIELPCINNNECGCPDCKLRAQQAWYDAGCPMPEPRPWVGPKVILIVPSPSEVQVLGVIHVIARPAVAAKAEVERLEAVGHRVASASSRAFLVQAAEREASGWKPVVVQA